MGKTSSTCGNKLEPTQTKSTDVTKKYVSGRFLRSWEMKGLLSTKPKAEGTWVAQSIKRPTLDLSSGLDPRAVSSSLPLGSMLGMEPT